MIQQKIIYYEPRNPDNGVVTHLRQGCIFDNLEANKQALYEILQANNLEWKANYSKQIGAHNNTINHSIAQTPIDTLDKYTDYVQHCLRIAVIGTVKTSNQIISGIIHAPVRIIGANDSIHQQLFIQSLEQYYKTLTLLSDQYNIYYGGGNISDRQGEQQDNNYNIEAQNYSQGEEALRYLIQTYLKQTPQKITKPKQIGNEMLYIKTQEQKIYSFYPLYQKNKTPQI